MHKKSIEPCVGSVNVLRFTNLRPRPHLNVINAQLDKNKKICTYLIDTTQCLCLTSDTKL